MPTRKKKTITRLRSTSKSRSLSLASLKKHINKFEWVLIPGTQENDILVSPTKIEDKYMFMYFLKRFWMQPLVRRYFIHKFRPDIEYDLVKLDYGDAFNKHKLAFIKRRIHEIKIKSVGVKTQEKSWIIDIAEQLKEGGGGHWTSLKYENGKLEYMDSDPFYYGAGSSSKDTLQDVIKNIPNPMEIYGSTNKNKSMFKAEKSIQNLHKKDIFCQSWSLFFLTISHLYPGLTKRIRFQEKKPVLHSDLDAQFANFPNFLENYRVLLDVWITLLEKDKGLGELVKDTQWRHWTASAMVASLGNIRRYLSKNENQFHTEMETQNDMFCIVKEEIGDYLLSSKK
jgi:hypothetical protein